MSQHLPKSGHFDDSILLCTKQKTYLIDTNGLNLMRPTMTIISTTMTDHQYEFEFSKAL
jgi:hypothetical protein